MFKLENWKYFDGFACDIIVSNMMAIDINVLSKSHCEPLTACITCAISSPAHLH